MQIPSPHRILSLTSVSLALGGLAWIAISHFLGGDRYLAAGEWLFVAGVSAYCVPLTLMLIVIPLSLAWHRWKT